MILSWVAITAAAWVIWLIQIIRYKEPRNFITTKDVRQLFASMNWGLWEWGYAAIILFIIFTLAFVAYVYPPNTYDSMTYHLPRVMHWAQDRSLVPYPTSIERQIQMQPLAELIYLKSICIEWD